MPGLVLAVDFGTSNTAAAFRDRTGNVEEVRLSTTGTLMPSAVFYTGDRVLVGRTALQAAFTAPEQFEPAPKRRMADREIFLAGTMVPVTDLVAAVFAEVLARAVQVMGAPPDEVVVTHPDRWGQPLQQMLAAAAQKGGVDEHHMLLVSESQAAAWFYAASAPNLEPGTRLAVFDFGAGTCDVAVLDKQADNSFAVIASDGIDGLGGQDLDARIYSWVRRQLADRDPVLLAEIDSPEAIASRLTLNDRIRDAKEALSEASSAAIVVAGAASTQVLQLTRDEFDDLINDDITRAVDLTEKVFTAANARSPSTQTPTIYLTGGSSLLPLVHTRLSELGPLGVLGDPKTVVVQGALLAPELSAQPNEAESTQTFEPETGGALAPAPAAAEAGTAAAIVGTETAHVGEPPRHAPAEAATAVGKLKPWIYLAAVGLIVGAVVGGLAIWTSARHRPVVATPTTPTTVTTSVSVSVTAPPPPPSSPMSHVPPPPITTPPPSTPLPSPAPPLTADQQRLLSLLPAGYLAGSCTPVADPPAGAVASMQCGQNAKPNGPTRARYTLFADAATVADHFQQIVSSESKLMPCPGDTNAPTTWHYNATPDQVAGKVACGTYKEAPDLAWTKDAALILGDATGPDLRQLHQWWLDYA